MLSHGSGSKSQLVTSTPEIIDSLSIQLNSSDSTPCNLVGDARSSRFRNDDLGLHLSGIVIHKIEIIRRQRASLSIIGKITSKEEVSLSLEDNRIFSVSEVEGEHIPSLLASHQRRIVEWELVVVEERIHHWAHHISEYVLANKVHRVFNDYDAEVNELVHDEGKDWVLVVQARVTE